MAQTFNSQAPWWESAELKENPTKRVSNPYLMERKTLKNLEHATEKRMTRLGKRGNGELFMGR